MNTESTLNLLDEDGENRAVRMFLALYGGTYSVTAERMREHLETAGYPYWPKWAESNDHLTKGGAQDWLRHLFALEAQPVSVGLTDALKAVDDEPELTDEVPPEMLAAMENAMRGMDVDFFIEAMRVSVRLAKEGIRGRLLSAAQQSSQSAPDTSADAPTVCAKNAHTVDIGSQQPSEADARDAAVRFAGEVLSNIAFNLAQRPAEPLTGDDICALDNARRQWDAAIAASREGK